MSKEFKGTPGHFFARSEELENGEINVFVSDQNGNSVAFCGNRPGIQERNAELFAAAPELLEALQDVLSVWIDEDMADVTDAEEMSLSKARTAINKALGETK